MMVQEDEFRYALISDLEAHVLELPYGTQDRLTMLVAMPRKGKPDLPLWHFQFKILLHFKVLLSTRSYTILRKLLPSKFLKNWMLSILIQEIIVLRF